MNLFIEVMIVMLDGGFVTNGRHQCAQAEILEPNFISTQSKMKEVRATWNMHHT